jgi:hypothetical protein
MRGRQNVSGQRDLDLDAVHRRAPLRRLPRLAGLRVSCDAIYAARPLTLEGMRAKASAAEVEARKPDGSEEAGNCLAEHWPETSSMTCCG